MDANADAPVTSPAPRATIRTTSPLRFFILNLITLGVYPAYWGWRRWEFIKRVNSEKLNASLRGLFFGFTSFSLLRRLQERAIEQADQPKTYNPQLMGALILGVNFAANILSKTNIPSGIYFLAWIAFAGLQAYAITKPTQTLDALLETSPEDRQVFFAIKHNVWLIVLLVGIQVVIFILGFLSALANSAV